MRFANLQYILVADGVKMEFCDIGGSRDSDAYVIREERGKWITAFRERGKEYDIVEFDNEFDACASFMKNVYRDKFTRKYRFPYNILIKNKIVTIATWKRKSDNVITLQDFVNDNEDYIPIFSDQHEAISELDQTPYSENIVSLDVTFITDSLDPLKLIILDPAGNKPLRFRVMDLCNNGAE